jgi:hypothetical protein
MRKILLLIALVIITWANLYAQKAAPQPPEETEATEAPVQMQEEVIETTTETENNDAVITTVDNEFDDENVQDTTLNERRYNESRIFKESLNSDDFAYMRSLDSLLRLKQKRENEALAEANKKKKAKDFEPKQSSNKFIDALLQGNAIKYFLITTGVLILLFAAFNIFFKGKLGKNKVTQSNVTEAKEVEVAVDEQTNFDLLITNALKAGNYPLATRYLYLQCLYQLQQAGAITIAKDKTSMHYIYEIKNAATRNSFAKATLNYEYAWFGNFTITEAMYQKISTSFNQLNLLK